MSDSDQACSRFQKYVLGQMMAGAWRDLVGKFDVQCDLFGSQGARQGHGA